MENIDRLRQIEQISKLLIDYEKLYLTKEDEQLLSDYRSKLIKDL